MCVCEFLLPVFMSAFICVTDPLVYQRFSLKFGPRMQNIKSPAGNRRASHPYNRHRETGGLCDSSIGNRGSRCCYRLIVKEL